MRVIYLGSRFRIPDRLLFILAISGGVPGAWSGSRQFACFSSL
ncbi:MAG: DUF1294 domain-containing protein, partial [Nitratireductor sp.]|nr:DUF1294 domain-containing protein [Nitratireductor sp.]